MEQAIGDGMKTYQAKMKTKSPSLKIKLGPTAHCAYLYEDGHAIVTHEERHPKAGAVEWAEVYEKVPVQCNFKGRIVFHYPKHDRLFREAIDAYSLTVREASVERGSENSKRKDIAIGHLEIDYSDGSWLRWTLMPDLISSGITYQPENTEKFSDFDDRDNTYCWGHVRINAIHRLPKAEPQLEVVAA